MVAAAYLSSRSKSVCVAPVTISCTLFVDSANVSFCAVIQEAGCSPAVTTKRGLSPKSRSDATSRAESPPRRYSSTVPRSQPACAVLGRISSRESGGSVPQSSLPDHAGQPYASRERRQGGNSADGVIGARVGRRDNRLRGFFRPRQVWPEHYEP
ncbi:hypothetical protein CFH99_00825 [Nocardioides aromaticivorans]|uniref:Uncharacterized protein n=1 Tax=Nocardioides aromaticivorans TaxID=200618 RepID=A0ABX7PED0_9ACTN|nr:hypothetical protein CFH99_00825 [Nocardioides aromaticivorans]